MSVCKVWIFGVLAMFLAAPVTPQTSTAVDASILCEIGQGKLASLSKSSLPENAKKFIPTLLCEIARSWPDAPLPVVFPAQIEQETCISLTHKRCWSPYAELKTSREYGFGLGQITVTKSFDNFTAAKRLDSSLKNWAWENRYNATYQLRTMVLMDKFNYGKLSWAANAYERMAATVAAYNGGFGGLLSDRGVCRSIPSCDESYWFGHIEKTSKKAKTAVGGYRKSFFEINREYVRNIMLRRGIKYSPYFE